MGIFSKKEKAQKSSCDKLQTWAKIAAPILRALYYVMIFLIFLSGIIALIMLLVNTSAQQMMLPPFMQLEGDTYSITIGNGIRIDAAYENVSLGDIKTVIYAELMMFAAACAIIAPVALFLSKLFANISKHDPQNARYITYIGLCVMVGSTFLRLARSFYNFLLVKTFVADPDAVRFAFEFDLGGIATGALIIVLAHIYENVCKARAVSEVPANSDTQM